MVTIKDLAELKIGRGFRGKSVDLSFKNWCVFEGLLVTFTVQFSRSVGFGNLGISQTGRGTGELYVILAGKFLIKLRSSEGLYK